nr:kinetochore-associated protein KNL-2-like protein isoform [Solanum lycopersicum]
MASPSTCQTQRVEEKKEPKSSNSSKSCFQPTVSLKDWWLIRAERDSQGRTLAVAGRTSREGQALRGFTSAPIHKIYDVFNLETIDGICVVLKGFINRSRSEENGFPSEGSPQQGKEAVRIVSPEPLSFNRSRSGRVLLPPMAFWRNQRAVYDADQSVTEVKQGDPNLDYLSRVCRSEPSKKRRQRR